VRLSDPVFFLKEKFLSFIHHEETLRLGRKLTLQEKMLCEWFLALRLE